MEFKYLANVLTLFFTLLKVLSYWNLNKITPPTVIKDVPLKVLSYWNLNTILISMDWFPAELKVLSYWNLNSILVVHVIVDFHLKYYHIGI